MKRVRIIQALGMIITFRALAFSKLIIDELTVKFSVI